MRNFMDMPMKDKEVSHFFFEGGLCTGSVGCFGLVGGFT